MNRATRKRMRRRQQARPTTARAAGELRARLITDWSATYGRRVRASSEDGETFRALKESELRQLGGTDADLRAFGAACAAQLFAAADRAAAGSPRVSAHLVSNYEAVELFELTELRRR